MLVAAPDVEHLKVLELDLPSGGEEGLAPMEKNRHEGSSVLFAMSAMIVSKLF